MTIEDARMALKSLAELSSNVIMSDSELEEALNSALSAYSEFGLTLDIHVTRAGELVAQYGGGDTSAPDAFVSSESVGKVQCRIIGRNCTAAKPERDHIKHEAFNLATPTLLQIVLNHWGTRNELTLLPHAQEGENPARLNNVFGSWWASDESVVIVHLDLDKFKEVNSSFSQAKGDEVLVEFGKRLRHDFGTQGIVIRYGGEEFLIAFHNRNIGDVFAQLERFRARMETEPFKAIARPNTCSMGVVCFPPENRQPVSKDDYRTILIAPAERASKFAKDEGRNRIRMAGSEIEKPSAESIVFRDLIHAALLSRQRLLPQDSPPFGDTFHNFAASQLSERLRGVALDQIETTVDDVVSKIGLKLHCNRGALWSETGSDPKLHGLKLASIVVYSLLRNALSGNGPLNSKDKLFLESSQADAKSPSLLSLRIERSDGASVNVKIGELAASQMALACYAGRPWRDRDLAELDAIQRWTPAAPLSISLSPCLLIAVGQGSMDLNIGRWAADTIQIDDRPVTGGGLPDFWQSNASRAVRAIVKNVNISNVLFVGDRKNASRTEQVLEELKRVDSHSRLGRRLSLDAEVLEHYRKRGIRIEWVEGTEEAVLGQFANIYFNSEDQLRANGDPFDVGAETTRHRLKLPPPPSPQGLKPVDGLRCGSLGDAYPRVIWLLRDTNVPENLDHMGRPFREVRGFKLVLESPLDDSVPDYWIEEKNELRQYFDREFLSQDGHFGSRLLQWGSTQGVSLDQIAEAVKETIKAIRQKIATRRIILFIAEPSDNWQAPLGLVACHVLPRRTKDGRWSLEFQWVWRTVEALVGFPFSCYGSIQLSERILDEVNRGLADNGHPHALMGELTYLALSLHLFMDEGDAEIARAVVTSSIA
jgi:diguanylate cyclase (GGDEF)-like protein